ncbi:MAG: HD domain-containing protein [Oligoflexia bacterium]|nr:HD domain-containing protein [Oligoflexia bacterium]
MKILHVEHEELIRELYAIEFEEKEYLEISSASTVEEAIQILQQNNDIKIIICGHKFTDGNSEKIYSLAKTINPEIAFILNLSFEGETNNVSEYKTFKDDNHNNHIVIKPNEAGTILTFINEVYNEIYTAEHGTSPTSLTSTTPSSTPVAPEDAFTNELGEFTLPSVQVVSKFLSPDKDENSYRRVGINRFLRMNTIPAEVYLKLGEEKFIKVINDNEPYDFSRIKKYIKKGVNYLYIPKAQSDQFINNYSSLLKSTLSKPDVPLKDRLEVQQDVLKLAHERANLVGIDKGVIEDMTVATNSVINTVYQNYDLFTMLSSMMKKNDYIVEHSLTTAFVAGHLATEIGWGAESTLQKIAMASMLHDVYLDKEHMASITCKNSVAFRALTEEEQQKVLTHPFNTASHIDQMANFLPDVSSIVFAHHEQPDGCGFPLGINSIRIPQITCAFIIAEDLVNCMYYGKVNANFFDNLTLKFKEKYNRGNFRVALEALISMLDKNSFE